MSFIDSTVTPFVKKTGITITTNSAGLWKKFRSLNKKIQLAVAIFLVALLFGGQYLLGKLSPTTTASVSAPTVTLATVGELSGGSSTTGIIGSVRSVSEATILAESGGKITSVNTSLGAYAGAGKILASIDNASQRAAVLQAQGIYESALAAKQGTSPGDIAGNARNTYTTAYTGVDIAIKSYLDTFYRGQGEFITDFLISSAPFDSNYFVPKRRELQQAMNIWASHQATAGSADPQTLLQEADTMTRLATALANDIATASTNFNTQTTPAQTAALASARSSLANIQASITAAKQSNRSQSTSSTAGADANIKTALGSLRAAQAILEKTFIRTPISGTVNFFTLHRGDYVTPLMHVATVAQNGALEIVSYASETAVSTLVVGQKVQVDSKYPGVVTSIAPALDPVKKQIELHVGITGMTELVDGQSVNISLPASKPSSVVATAGPLLLPLSAVKLTPSARVVFSVADDGRLVSHTVEIGDVRGDRIEILTELPKDLAIVVDARGLSEGEKVQIAQLAP